MLLESKRGHTFREKVNLEHGYMTESLRKLQFTVMCNASQKRKKKKKKKKEGTSSSSCVCVVTP